MSYKQVPITAKILKTTKGGVTQPILNMGAPVKMKAPSPAQRQSQPKARIDGEAGWAADDLARKNKTGQYTKITGKIGSDLRRQQYKDKGWANDATTMKPKVKAANTIKAKKGVDVKKARTTSLETKLDPKALKTQVAKVNSKKAEPSKGDVRKANRKLDSADRKDSRASRVSQKAKDARASGNTAKADRLDRRVGRIKKRANKKRGQAAGAIQPK